MKKILLTLVALQFAVVLHSQSKVEDVKNFTLSNGMKIMVLEDHSIPNANMYLFWKVGSRNEYPGITGLSHFFEHMMFNGSKKYGPKMFDRTMEAAGGSNNAYTTENITVYTDWFPSEAMEVIFDLESDRIENLVLDPKMVESERGVVLSERSTGLENSNFRNISDAVKGSAFMAHPYRWSVIGYESDIKNWTIDDLQTYFDTYYAPNNAVVVISGDVSLEKVKKMAKQYLEPIKAQPEPRKVHTVEPEQRGEKRVMVHKNVSTPNVLIAYHVPETKHEDYYALDLLSAVLSSGKSSKLYSKLVNGSQLATNIFTYMPESFDPNLFYVFGIANQEVSADSLEKGIFEVLDDVIVNGVTEEELQKVKNQKLMEFYKTLETINGKSNTIGTYELYFGDYKKMYAAPSFYEKVSVADLQRVAKKYLIKRNRTVGVLQNNELATDEESK
ncbi:MULTISPECIES: M16 family metallopeptidase [Cellulophaga]|uniref:Peptidase M16 n=1 Tax=Cellulophaga baltica 18 TaxID=1348584 RepID=A0AAU8S127_9FLAO|nr:MULTISPECIES: pitrilysin family protein [Cellulophaga]AIY14735.1 peptidase M16 [Cellulophaga baltica NN016038]AIZ43109.1 peptidase M16 [Cellulophaga baltica 18]KGK31570.1 peptidase M16 [Cellulophaga sp. E6(2014)]MCR1024039.1 insulinase family protein [Cellulophaga baltica]